HYQPTQPLIILGRNKRIENLPVEKISAELGRPLLFPVAMKLAEQPFEAARTLYSEMRRLSLDSKHLIVVERNAEQSGEDWEAIWDRLERAATKISCSE